MKMGLLKSVDNVPGIDYYEYRDSQYYNKYEYRMRFKLPMVRYTWWCKTPEDLATKIDSNKGWGAIKKSDVQVVKDNLPALQAMIEVRNDRKKSKDFSLRIEQSTVAIFSNDLQTLKDLVDKFGATYSYDYTQVQTSEYAGIKHFVEEPNHKFRVYLKSRRVDDTFPVELRKMFSKVKGLHPSPALLRWVTDYQQNYNWRSRWSSASYFIDYDDESTLSYLALMYDSMLGKKYKLEKRPEAT